MKNYLLRRTTFHRPRTDRPDVKSRALSINHLNIYQPAYFPSRFGLVAVVDMVRRNSTEFFAGNTSTVINIYNSARNETREVRAVCIYQKQQRGSRKKSHYLFRTCAVGGKLSKRLGYNWCVSRIESGIRSQEQPRYTLSH